MNHPIFVSHYLLSFIIAIVFQERYYSLSEVFSIVALGSTLNLQVRTVTILQWSYYKHLWTVPMMVRAAVISSEDPLLTLSSKHSEKMVRNNQFDPTVSWFHIHEKCTYPVQPMIQNCAKFLLLSITSFMHSMKKSEVKCKPKYEHYSFKPTFADTYFQWHITALTWVARPLIL